MIAFRKLYSPTVIKVVWWLTVILAALFLIVSEYFGIRLWSIALGVGQEQPAATETPLPFPTEEPFSTEEPFPTEGPFPTDPNVFGQLGELFAQFLAGLAIAMIVLPPVIAVLCVVWTRLILEALVVHFKVEDNTRRTPLVDQTQPTS
jgi:hypothetical protein